MATISIELDDELARHVQESAQRERKSVSEWLKERVRAEANGAASLAALEAKAVAHGYPADWLTLFGSLADDDRFAAPTRSACREAADLN